MQTQTSTDNQTGDFNFDCFGFVNLTNNLHLVTQGQLRSIAESKWAESRQKGVVANLHLLEECEMQIFSGSSSLCLLTLSLTPNPILKTEARRDGPVYAPQ